MRKVVATARIAFRIPRIPSRRSSRPKGTALSTSGGASSQNAVVCISTAGMSSSPDPTFSFVKNLIFLKPTTCLTT